MALAEVAGLLLVLLGASVIVGVELLLMLDYIVEKVGRRPRGKLSRRLRVPWTILFVTGVGCALYAHYVEPFRFEVTHHTVRGAGLPKDFRLRIVQVTDLHLEGDGKTTEWILRTVREEKPHIIALTGDYVNDETAGREAFKKLLSQLEAPHVLAVTGNCDRYSPSVLDNDIVTLHGFARSINVKGRYVNVFGCGLIEAQAFGQLMTGLPKAAYTVVLYHKPRMMELAAKRGADLYLCGHTHGGQVCVPFYGAVVTLSDLGKRYESGLYRVGDMTAYVCRGIGCQRGIPRLRFLCRPEIAVFDIVGDGQPRTDEAGR